ncbi:TPA: hypothetical protein ACGN81_005321 [Bacillus cereus]
MKNYACTRGYPREWKEIHISRFRWGSCDSCGEVPQVFGCYREKQHGREDIVEKGSRNLKRYEEILSKLQEGNVIFGRMERIKRKQSVENG